MTQGGKDKMARGIIVQEYKTIKTVKIDNSETIEVIFPTNGNNQVPTYSVKSKYYAIPDRQNGIIHQIVFYDNNNKLLYRLDWGHIHKKSSFHKQDFKTNEIIEINEHDYKMYNKLKNIRIDTKEFK